MWLARLILMALMAEGAAAKITRYGSGCQQGHRLPVGSVPGAQGGWGCWGWEDEKLGRWSLRCSGWEVGCAVGLGTSRFGV